MILRRPYAILIKYFKLIHIIMFIFFAYFVFVIRKIYLFFSDYVKTSNFTYFEDMTARYVPIFVFFMIILLLGFAIGIFLLMRRKDKPVLFYRILITYLCILLVVFIYLFIFFNSLDATVYEPLRIVINRDIVLFIYIINFFFVAFSFIRGFGFDIKKFSFEKDKKELKLDESDSEEVEVNVSIEKEDIINYFNRQKREFKYYLKDNSLIFTILGVVVIVGVIVFVYLNFFVINKTYHEKEEIVKGKLTYVVNNSYVTNVDKYGKLLNTKNDYLIVDLSIVNNQATGHLDQEAIRLHVDDEYYYPLTSSCELFSDIGECYKNQELKVNTKYDFIVAYKIKNEYKKVYLEILKNKGDEYKYHKIALDYKRFDVKESNLQMNEVFKINNDEYKILNYEVLDRTSFQYEECENEVCNTYTKTVSPIVGEAVLALEIENMDKLSDDLLSSIIGLTYNNKNVYGSDIKLLDRHDNVAYYSVKSVVKSVNDLKLLITTRNNKYKIALGGGSSE